MYFRYRAKTVHGNGFIIALTCKPKDVHNQFVRIRDINRAREGLERQILPEFEWEHIYAGRNDNNFDRFF